jgi:hypothetical protein
VAIDVVVPSSTPGELKKMATEPDIARQVELLRTEVASLRKEVATLTTLAKRLDRTMGSVLDQMRATCDQLIRMNDDRL